MQVKQRRMYGLFEVVRESSDSRDKRVRYQRICTGVPPLPLTTARKVYQNALLAYALGGCERERVLRPLQDERGQLLRQR